MYLWKNHQGSWDNVINLIVELLIVKYDEKYIGFQYSVNSCRKH